MGRVYKKNKMPPIPLIVYHPTLLEQLRNDWIICLVNAIIIISCIVYPEESSYICRTMVTCFIALVQSGEWFVCQLSSKDTTRCTCHSCNFALYDIRFIANGFK